VPEPATLAGLLLVLGPVVGLIPVAHPALIPVWSASRERQLEIVATHRRAWWALNAGFGLATVATAAGLAILALTAHTAAGSAALVPGAVAYLAGGVLWCAVLAIRSRVTPLLGALVAAGTPTEPAETLVGAAQGGLFAGFVLATAAALLAVGAGLIVADVVPAVVGLVQVIAGAGVLLWLLAAGDVIPAVIYLPTLVLGLALLAGRS
jgi:hypothetical protein